MPEMVQKNKIYSLGMVMLFLPVYKAPKIFHFFSVAAKEIVK
jgi:hypothetical protein